MTDAIVLILSSNIPAGGTTATTARLAVPANYVAGDFDAGKISDDTNPLPGLDLGDHNYTEIEFCLTPFTGSAVDGSDYEFRVTVAGVALDFYDVTPVLTVSPLDTGGTALAGSGTLSAVGTVLTTTILGAAVLAGSGTIVASPILIQQGAAALAGTATISALGGFLQTGAGALAASSAIAAAAGVDRNGIIVLAGTSVLAAAGVENLAGAVALNGTGTLVARGGLSVTPGTGPGTRTIYWAARRGTIRASRRNKVLVEG